MAVDVLNLEMFLFWFHIILPSFLPHLFIKMLILQPVVADYIPSNKGTLKFKMTYIFITLKKNLITLNIHL